MQVSGVAITEPLKHPGKGKGKSKAGMSPAEKRAKAAARKKARAAAKSVKERKAADTLLKKCVDDANAMQARIAAKGQEGSPGVPGKGSGEITLHKAKPVSAAAAMFLLGWMNATVLLRHAGFCNSSMHKCAPNSICACVSDDIGMQLPRFDTVKQLSWRRQCAAVRLGTPWA